MRNRHSALLGAFVISAIAIRFLSSSVLVNKWALEGSPATVRDSWAMAWIDSFGFAVESLRLLAPAFTSDVAGTSDILMHVSVHALSKRASMLGTGLGGVLDGEVSTQAVVIVVFKRRRLATVLLLLLFVLRPCASTPTRQNG